MHSFPSMRQMVRVAPVSVAVGWLLLVFETPIQAYLDPGSGSMLLQVLLGGFAAVGVVGKLYWSRLTSLFRSTDRKPPTAE